MVPPQKKPPKKTKKPLLSCSCSLRSGKDGLRSQIPSEKGVTKRQNWMGSGQSSLEDPTCTFIRVSIWHIFLDRPNRISWKEFHRRLNNKNPLIKKGKKYLLHNHLYDTFWVYKSLQKLAWCNPFNNHVKWALLFPSCSWGTVAERKLLIRPPCEFMEEVKFKLGKSWTTAQTLITIYITPTVRSGRSYIGHCLSQSVSNFFKYLGHNYKAEL